MNTSTNWRTVTSTCMFINYVYDIFYSSKRYTAKSNTSYISNSNSSATTPLSKHFAQVDSNMSLIMKKICQSANAHFG